mmetsp:Transcript_24743/g.62218  ORF Transcript_24743/g.62218 Transcript_24743/m.62218 type:complete len:275 (-) Transcript_24743:68-892(-)|eukprot:CAMPEP_0178995232 /NCGR_PEP_ID=MMETSP0795-20121207/7724_1 /TAXON_ID=88552 /ORGANISM="Amoebophrya sp., Strain Ameob2" /LENGTH=274 /DNA_ID=CAMNT_0020687539 /DNA_START=106 /DNA_END=930 /DNA_ORIENTATION=+
MPKTGTSPPISASSVYLPVYYKAAATQQRSSADNWLCNVSHRPDPENYLTTAQAVDRRASVGSIPKQKGRDVPSRAELAARARQSSIFGVAAGSSSAGTYYVRREEAEATPGDAGDKENCTTRQGTMAGHESRGGGGGGLLVQTQHQIPEPKPFEPRPLSEWLTKCNLVAHPATEGGEINKIAGSEKTSFGIKKNDLMASEKQVLHVPWVYPEMGFEAKEVARAEKERKKTTAEMQTQRKKASGIANRNKRTIMKKIDELNKSSSQLQSLWKGR